MISCARVPIISCKAASIITTSADGVIGAIAVFMTSTSARFAISIMTASTGILITSHNSKPGSSPGGAITAHEKKETKSQMY